MWKSALLTKAALMRFSTVRRLPATLYAPCTAAHPLARALILQPGAGLIPGAKDHGGRSPKKIKIPSRKREERGVTKVKRQVDLGKLLSAKGEPGLLEGCSRLYARNRVLLR